MSTFHILHSIFGFLCEGKCNTYNKNIVLNAEQPNSWLNAFAHFTLCTRNSFTLASSHIHWTSIDSFNIYLGFVVSLFRFSMHYTPIFRFPLLVFISCLALRNFNSVGFAILYIEIANYFGFLFGAFSIPLCFNRQTNESANKTN